MTSEKFIFNLVDLTATNQLESYLDSHRRSHWAQSSQSFFDTTFEFSNIYAFSEFKNLSLGKDLKHKSSKIDALIDFL